MDNNQLSRDHHVTDHFRKKSIIFRDMRTQGERNAEVRLSISCPSAEKTDSQIYRLKKTDLTRESDIPNPNLASEKSVWSCQTRF